MIEQTPQKHEIMTVRIQACPEQICIVRAAVNKTLEMLHMDPDIAAKVILAVDEALTNIIRHSYEKPCHLPITLTLGNQANAPDRQTITITILDQGKQVHPDQIKSRDLDEIRPGGLGVHIIQSVMDHVKYTPRPQGGMQLTMTKDFTPVPTTE